MANIRIALTNLGKYNEGDLVYKWVDLPATDEELAEAYREIGISDDYEEHFISDYEAPGGLRIGEYSDIDKLNELAELLEDIDIPETSSFDMWDATDIINFAHDLMNEGIVDNAHEYIDDIVDDEGLDEMARHMIENGDGWHRVSFFLQDADRTADWHLIDGYGNVARLTNDHLDSIVSDLMNEIQASI
jgi:antirestriction protein